MGLDHSRLEVASDLEWLSGHNVFILKSMTDCFSEKYRFFGINRRIFEAMMEPLIPNSKKMASHDLLERTFKLLDTNEDGVVDSFELFAGLVALAEGHVDQRMKLLFDVFDLEGIGKLNVDEVNLFVACSLSALHKFCSFPKVPATLPRTVADQAFADAGASTIEGRISRSQFVSWWHHDGEVRLMLKKLTRRSTDDAGLPSDIYQRDYLRAVGLPGRRIIERKQVEKDKRVDENEHEGDYADSSADGSSAVDRDSDKGDGKDGGEGMAEETAAES